MGFFRKRDRQRARDETPVDAPEEAESEPSPAPPVLQWGRPTPCPKCEKRGYLDSIDHARRVMYQHCKSCWHDWTVTEEDIQNGTLPE
jgi:hypothetical protein